MRALLVVALAATWSTTGCGDDDGAPRDSGLDGARAADSGSDASTMSDGGADGGGADGGGGSGSDIVSFDGGHYPGPCALRRDGELFCSEDGAAEPQVFAHVSTFTGGVQVARGSQTTCVRFDAGNVQCFGRHWLGDGSDTASDVPVDVLDLADAAFVDTWVNHTCAVRATGVVSCWGSNSDGEIEAGGAAQYLTPHDIAGIDDAVEVAVTRLSTCVLHADGTVSCWGSDGFDPTPTVIPGVTGVEITGGHFHYCVRAASGALSCFGGTSGAVAAAVPSPISDAAEAVALHSETCYRTTEGHVRCWGAEGRPSDPPGALEEIAGIDDAVRIAWQCAVRASGVVSCWQDRSRVVDAIGL